MIDLTKLDPKLQLVIPIFIQKCVDEGMKVIIIQGFRDLAYQKRLFDQGLSKASGIDGPHCQLENGLPCAKAFDFAVIDLVNGYVKDGGDYRYLKAGQIAKSMGLHWGGDFHSFHDPDHVELADWKTI